MQQMEVRLSLTSIFTVVTNLLELYYGYLKSSEELIA